MLTLAARFRDILIPFLIAGLVLIVVMLAGMLIQRLVLALQQRRHAGLIRRSRPLVDPILSGETAITPAVVAILRRRPRRVIAELILAPLSVVTGDYNEHARELADALGLTPEWRRDLGDRRWWRAAAAALAVGLVHDHQSVPALLTLLDHEHEQVRASAIDALGTIGAPEALTPLISRMKDPTRHERAGVGEALRAYGDEAAEALVTLGNTQPDERPLVAALLVDVGTAAAGDSLLAWTADPTVDTRAAAWRAIAAIGPTDRHFYHALKALTDPDSSVRTAAARALGRTHRPDGARYLGAVLDDDWDVAAQAARSLGRLGAPGLAVLHARLAQGEGLGRDLATQVIWESERLR